MLISDRIRLCIILKKNGKSGELQVDSRKSKIKPLLGHLIQTFTNNLFTKIELIFRQTLRGLVSF